MSIERPKPKTFAPLCGRIFRDTDPQYFPSAPYRRRMLIFCAKACLGAFHADPTPFYKARQNSESETKSNGKYDAPTQND